MDYKKEVYFVDFCYKCKHYNDSEGSDPCHECLQTPARESSHTPEHFDLNPNSREIPPL